MAEKKKPSFGRVMLLYALIFFVLLIGGLGALRLYLGYAEANGPDAAARAWLEELDEAHLRAAAADWLAGFDETLFPADELFDRSVAPLRSELSFRALAEESGAEKAVYTILAGAQPLGRITLAPEEGGELGTRVWRVSGEEFDFSFLGSPVSRSLTVPEGFTVSCGGRTLDAAYISGRAAGCAALDYLAEAGYAQPAFVTYTADRCPAWAEFSVFAPDGEEYGADTDFEALAAAQLENSCSAAERERLERFAADFCASYVGFLGARRGSAGSEYRKILPFLLEDSELAERMASANKGLAWSHNRKNEIVDFRVNACLRLGEGEYVCDYSFSVDTLGLAGTVRTENNIRLFVVERDGELFASQLLNYG